MPLCSQVLRFPEGAMAHLASPHLQEVNSIPGKSPLPAWPGSMGMPVYMWTGQCSAASCACRRARRSSSFPGRRRVSFNPPLPVGTNLLRQTASAPRADAVRTRSPVLRQLPRCRQTEAVTDAPVLTPWVTAITVSCEGSVKPMSKWLTPDAARERALSGVSMVPLVATATGQPLDEKIPAISSRSVLRRGSPPVRVTPGEGSSPIMESASVWYSSGPSSRGFPGTL